MPRHVRVQPPPNETFLEKQLRELGSPYAPLLSQNVRSRRKPRLHQVIVAQRATPSQFRALRSLPKEILEIFLRLEMC